MYMVHRDESYYPNPTKFSPERWLDQTESRRLEKAFVPFSRGPRSCAGIKYASLYFGNLHTLICQFTNNRTNKIAVWHIANSTLRSARSSDASQISRATICHQKISYTMITSVRKIRSMQRSFMFYHDETISSDIGHRDTISRSEG